MTVITNQVQGPLGTRQEIRTFFQDADLTNLYLLALSSLQAVDQGDLLSWFQISGIHGRPYTAYDGVSSTSGRQGAGYCTHSSILFPTWHRPYLALYEQTLTAHVNKIANAYTDPALKQKYLAAAARFRIPYWDWATDPTLPSIIATQKTVQVVRPTGPASINNPLFQYSFHPIGTGLGSPFGSYHNTVRWGSSRDPTTSQPTAMNSALNNNKLTLRDRTYNLLTQATNYAAFSNDGFLGSNSDPRWFDSLESIHGQIHTLVGGNGHMSVVDVAAFDPIFWLHHANADRLLAIWQAINPAQFVIARPTGAGTFTTQPGTVENADSILTPFRQTANQMWTSNGARDTRTFGYTYPELAQWSSLTAQDKAIRVRQTVNELYGRTAPSGIIRNPLLPGLTTLPAAAHPRIANPEDSVPVQAAFAAPAAQPIAAMKVAAAPPATAQPRAAMRVAPAAPAAQPSHEPAAGQHTTGGHKQYHEWIANIRVKKYAVDSTFIVHVFLGDFNPDPTTWATERNLVGSHAVFTSNPGTDCARCIEHREGELEVTGTIPLTGALGEKFNGVTDLQPQRIVPYLQKELHWRIAKPDGTVIERQQIPSLKLSVSRMLVDVPDSQSEFPRWGQAETHLDVTRGRPGGANAGDL